MKKTEREKPLGFTTLNRIITKVRRDLRDDNITDIDIIEWAGEALDYLKVPGFLQEAISFQEVKDYTTPLPRDFSYVRQIAKLNDYSEHKPALCDLLDNCSDDISNDCSWVCMGVTDGIPVDCEGRPLIDVDLRYYFPIATLEMQWDMFTKSKSYDRFTLIRKATSTFFHKEIFDNDYYENCVDEYTIREGNILFSFMEGYVAISYYKHLTDCETGYPLIPDTSHVINAITYYIKWKVAEQYAWEGKRGFITIAQDMERKWLKYIKQAKTHLIKPKTIDDYQDLLEQSLRLIPIRYSYYDHFKNLSKNI